MLNATFHGVRSSEGAGAVTGRYGSHTACVALEVPGRGPILCDAGTGLRRWVASAPPGPPPRARVLLTHLHRSHVAGLVHLPGPVELELYGPAADGERPLDTLHRLLGPDAAAQPREGLRFVPVEEEELALGDAKVLVRRVPHRGATYGYRVDWEGAVVAYVSHHRGRRGLDAVPQAVLELADGADLLVHDARLGPADPPHRPTRGHSPVDYAVLVAREAGARCVALFHHDRASDDHCLDVLLTAARRTAERLGVDEVIMASEGTTVSLER